MVVAEPKQADIYHKIIVLARGNVTLVQDAIRSCSIGKKDADLGDVVGFILAHRADGWPR